MGLGGGAAFIVFWYIPLEDQFPFFSPSISQLIVGFSSLWLIGTWYFALLHRSA
jgi:hypothetical protein